MFSVIIPTMQRSGRLTQTLTALQSHDLVTEILVANNSGTELPWHGSKLRLIHCGPNLGVNPAWNLGATEALSSYLAIVNDDVTFDLDVLPVVARRLERGSGIVAISSSSFRQGPCPSRPVFRPVYFMPYQFGVCMFMRRESYVPIPDDLVIWYGDDWLFRHQRATNYVLDGVCASTDMSTTASAGEFTPRKTRDTLAFRQRYAASDPYGDRHRVRRWLGRQRSRAGERLFGVRKVVWDWRLRRSSGS